MLPRLEDVKLNEVQVETLATLRADLVNARQEQPASQQGNDMLSKFDEAITRLWGAENLKLLTPTAAEPHGAAVMSLRLQSLRDTARCTDQEHRQYAQRLSLGHVKDVKDFIASRKPLPRGTFGPTAVDKKSQDVVDWALGRKRVK